MTSKTEVIKQLAFIEDNWGETWKEIKIFLVVLINEIIYFPYTFIFRKNNNENVAIIN